MSGELSARPAVPVISGRRAVNARQAETVQRLLAAADAEVRATGPDALTIRAVALRAGVSSATAYTYFASRNHLFAELFWQLMQAEGAHRPAGATPLERVRDVTRRLTATLESSPELAAAVTPALLGNDPDVERLRGRIGGDFAGRFAAALAPEVTGERAAVLVETLALAFSGALLQAGMGVMGYAEMGARLDAVVATILEGNA